MSLSVIIPSKTFSNLRACVTALHANEPALRLIVVDDGLEASFGYQPRSFEYSEGSCLDGSTIIPGIKPFVFARNCNLGIKAADDDDVILLNDDAMLKTTLGFTQLLEVAEDNPTFGVISATTNVAGNRAQYHRGIGLREEARTVAFICVLIPRVVIDKVGLLDERYTAYGWDDNDYCRRVREHGLKIGIFDGCFVDHESLRSTFRGHPHTAGDISAGAEIYLRKWGSLE